MMWQHSGRVKARFFLVKVVPITSGLLYLRLQYLLMNKVSSIFNVALLVAVGVMSSCNQEKGTDSSRGAATSAITGELRVAYINSDTVLEHYDYLKVQKEQLVAKTQKMEQEYRNRAMGLQNEIAAYQRNVSSMTLGQVKATEEDLGKKQQNLQLFQQSLGQQLMEEENKLNKELYDRVTAYAKKYAEEKGIHIVLKRDQTSDVLWATDALDISQDVIKGLNAEYASEKNGTATVKADSTAAK